MISSADDDQEQRKEQYADFLGIQADIVGDQAENKVRGVTFLEIFVEKYQRTEYQREGDLQHAG